MPISRPERRDRGQRGQPAIERQQRFLGRVLGHLRDAVALRVAADVRPGDAQQRLQRRRVAGAGGLDQSGIDACDESS